MKIEQFEAISELIRARGGVSEESAKLVLVNGLTARQAADMLGCPTQTVYSGVQRFTKAFELAKTAAQ
jgi:DNA-directed RNA polymerase specialized sigma24 family protein